MTVPSAYNGCVRGGGNVTSGLAIFTLSSIKKSDERFYNCVIRPNDAFDKERFDAVHLVVEGEYVKYCNSYIIFGFVLTVKSKQCGRMIANGR